jgi:hypothetical protein
MQTITTIPTDIRARNTLHRACMHAYIRACTPEASEAHPSSHAHRKQTLHGTFCRAIDKSSLGECMHLAYTRMQLKTIRLTLIKTTCAERKHGTCPEDTYVRPPKSKWQKHASKLQVYICVYTHMLSLWHAIGKKARAAPQEGSQLPPPCCLVVCCFRNEQSQPGERRLN